MRFILGLGIVIGTISAAHALTLDFGESCPGLTPEECSDVIAEIEIDGVYCQGLFIAKNKPLYDLCRAREEWIIQLKKMEAKHCGKKDPYDKDLCASLRKDIIGEAVRRLNYLTDDNMEN